MKKMSNVYKTKRSFRVLDAIDVVAMTKEQCVNEIFELPVEPVSASISFVGVPAVISAIENPEIKEMYKKSTLVAIDGMPVVKIGRKLGFEKCERCDGPSIMDLVLKESVKHGKTHYFYGGKNDEVLERLVNNLKEKYPDIKIAGTFSPPFRNMTAEEDESLCEEINKLNPDFIWVGVGAPKQDFWIQNHVNKIHNTKMLGVGAAFDFFAGSLDKAPEWISDAGIEWLYRFIKEPKRLWNRYIIGGFKFIFYYMKRNNCKI